MTPTSSSLAHSPVTVVVGDWASLAEAAKSVRYPVFVLEQGVPHHLEMDEHDATSVHVVVFSEDGSALATGRLLPDGRVGRMAVLASHRGKGLGAKILQAIIALAKERGQTRLYLHAQVRALPFYERAGFVAEGGAYFEAGIEHRSMVLDPAKQS